MARIRVGRVGLPMRSILAGLECERISSLVTCPGGPNERQSRMHSIPLPIRIRNKEHA